MEVQEDVESIEVRCLHCREWSPSPIFVSPWGALAEAMITANRVQCPHCNRMTGCNKENYRVFFKGGGFRGADTI